MASQRDYVKTPNGKFEHRVIYENRYGKLPKDWHVHHINGTKDDNRIENLMGLPAKCHKDLHFLMKANQWMYSTVELEEYRDRWIASNRRRLRKKEVRWEARRKMKVASQIKRKANRHRGGFSHEHTLYRKPRTLPKPAHRELAIRAALDEDGNFKTILRKAKEGF